MKEGGFAIYSTEAEVALLSGAMLSNSHIHNLLDIPVDAFYSSRHQAIFKAVKFLAENNQPVDLISVVERLKADGTLKDAGGQDYVADVAMAITSPASWPHYKALILEKYNLRETYRRCQEVLSSIENGWITEDEKALDLLDSHITNLYNKNIKKDFTPLSDSLIEGFKQIEKNSQNINGFPGLDTGFIDLNRKTGGLQKSDLIILAARPSMGKTALAINIATNVAKQGKSVGVFSLEMSKVQLANRILSGEGQVNNERLRIGDLGENDWSKINDVNSRIMDLPIFIDDSTDITINQMRAKCRNLKKKKGLDLIVIDYLQLISGSGGQFSREREISEFSRGLKGLGKDLDVPVLCLSQLNRKLEERGDKRPVLSDLRESGAIEQDADIVIFIYRDEVYSRSSDENRNIAEIHIAKQRNGGIGFFKMVFRKEFTLFGDYYQDIDYER